MRELWRRHLGNITGIRERSRDAWSFRWLETLQQDLRYAFRGLRRSPGFTAAVIVTLGLGIGANAAMFGVIDRLMFRPLDYMKDPASVRRVYLQTSFPRHFTNTVFPYTRYLDFQKTTNSFSGFAAFTQNIAVVGVGDEAREEPVLGVSASFFDFFDAHPVAGRFLSAADDQTPNGANVAVLSYGYWQSRYGGRDVLGQTVKILNYECTIIGVGLGVALALAASRWLQPLLYEQSAKDPIVYTLVAVVLLLVSIAASTAPALRAAKADPNAALRSD